ncbi:RagB/SusD family nutrient uptake outer membrane protein [Confluentibacter flavum]|uniref:RagB/SusD family nutrient uptake outer membrane protein n=1 Tax=Confluentibacter flavum TaxID=1909700 RepID=A0A2N3HKL7_9FLAO|nr:RagB/SusD family nutrient uptake outer membrane protein [Confluentibacter flavum]PKQ45398.1 RagB/SusD family nutrient uptake outer membrane protein [Confluentibacter flavum]
MKNIVNLLTLIAFVMIVSCSADFIEIKPESTVSIDILYKTDKDFQDAVIGCYQQLQVQYRNFWVFGDLRSDDSQQEIFSNISLLTVDNFTLSSDSNLIRDSWLNYYRIINRANNILNEIENTDPSIVVNKDRHLAEAKFLRALAYFDLVRIFGDVPMVTTVISQEEAHKIPRTPVDKIYSEVIIPDLMVAENNLSSVYTGSDLGRATKGAAKSLLGKVYLTTHDFAKAEAKLQEVTTMGYALLPTFDDLFDYSKDEHHSEYIFDIEYEAGINSGSNFTNDFLPIAIPMANYYNVVGGLGERNSPTQSIFDEFDNQGGDLRAYTTVGVKGGWIDGNGNFNPLLPNTSQSYTLKYITSVAIGGDSKANWKVIRYADVLLMYAEALNENGKTTESLDYLNLVRSRAGLNGYSGLSKDQTREVIYTERRLELAFEGHRWFDLVRTGRAYNILNSEGMQQYMTVFPVPLSQVQIINDRNIFPQNEGYD